MYLYISIGIILIALVIGFILDKRWYKQHIKQLEQLFEKDNDE